MINSMKVRKGVAEEYVTKSGLVPPSAAIPFYSVDEGNSAPKFLRCTVMQAPQD